MERFSCRSLWLEGDGSKKELKQDVGIEQRSRVKWGPNTEKHIRLEFVCFLSALVRGYRECLFSVNQKLSVFKPSADLLK
ncbi:hypothetical protein CCR75_006892 [Bremia lactucae]|uniref:Uncharacterized protein n=1 Tax=Bremia lactucae TaxID=4779 RepID=A0A976FFB6_BRELC|nr:hypothetical protein CCR75_006892 [Bremia lactucae]